MNKLRRIHVLALFSILCFSSSCYLLPPKWIGKEYGINQPAKQNYKLSKKEFHFYNVIDTNSIYLIQNMYVLTNRRGELVAGERLYYNFIRFSGHGVVFIRSLMTHPPMTSDVNSMVGGQFCYYTFIEPLVIKIERYNYDTRIFEYWYGKIQSNGDLLIYEERGRPWRTYVRKDRNYLYKLTPAKIERPVVFPTY